MIKVFTLGGSEYITFAIGRLSLIGLIDAKDGDGRTPLHIAAQQGCMASITLLLDGGATIEAVDSSSRTPLHIAAYYHKFDAVKYLISRGANTNAKDKVGKSPHYYLISEYRAYDKKRRSTSDSVQQSCTIQSQAERLDVFELLIGKANIEDRDDDGQTPFHVAAQKGKLGVARLLVNKIESVNFEDSLHEEPDELVRAVRQRERLKFLINQKDKFDYTPLQYAAKNGNWGMVNLFLDKTAERNQDDVAGKDEFSTSWTTVHYAVYNGNMDLLNYIFPLLSDKNTVMNMKDSSGWTPLHYAVHYNALDMVKFLVNEGANVNAKDNDGNTLLHDAAREGDLDMVKFLIKNGADINVKNSRNLIPLQVVGSNSNVERVLRQAHLDKELLLTVKNEKDLKTINDLIAKDIDDRTRGVFYYTWSGNLGKVELLVSKDVSVNATDKYGCTLLHWSALKGHSDIAKFLVDKGANVNAKDILGRTPMHFAAMNNHNDIQDACDRGPMYTAAESNDEEFIQLFLMKGASINEADKNGETPLHLASWGGHLDILQRLISNGANISAKDSSDRTPLDVARDKGHNNLAQCLQQIQLVLDKQLLIAIGNSDLNKVRGLVAQGANIDTNDKNGNTLLYSAAEIGDLNLVKLLLDNGANIEAKNGEYQATPLHGAVENYRIDVVKLLLNCGANVNAEDKDNWTPLHYAADTNSLDIVKVLVDAHANLGAKGNYGKTPLDIAKDKGHNNIMEYLEQKLREERGKPLQRKRRHHHGDHNHHHSHLSHKPLAIGSSNQPEIAASSGTRTSSWVNDLFNWVKSSIGELLSSNTTSSILQIDRQIDVDGAIMLIDLLIRKVTGQKYISLADQSISLLEAQGYALNIIEKFEKVLNETAIKSGISVTNLNFDPVVVQSAIIGKIINGKFSEISKTLYSFAKEACPEFKQTDKFLDNLRSNLKEEKETVMLQQKVEKPSKILDQQVSGKVELSNKPDTFLNGTSVVRGISRAIN